MPRPAHFVRCWDSRGWGYRAFYKEVTLATFARWANLSCKILLYPLRLHLHLPSGPVPRDDLIRTANVSDSNLLGEHERVWADIRDREHKVWGPTTALRGCGGGWPGQLAKLGGDRLLVVQPICGTPVTALTFHTRASTVHHEELAKERIGSASKFRHSYRLLSDWPSLGVEASR